MSYYRLHVESERTKHRVEGTSPARALRRMVAAAGLELRRQDGRYGKLMDGRSCSALTEPHGRRRLDPLERTTRSRA